MDVSPITTVLAIAISIRLPLIPLPALLLPAVPLSGFVRVTAGLVDVDAATPDGADAAKGVDSTLGFVGGGEVDEEVVMVSWLGAFGGVRGDDFADCLAVLFYFGGGDVLQQGGLVWSITEN